MSQKRALRQVKRRTLIAWSVFRLSHTLSIVSHWPYGMHNTSVHKDRTYRGTLRHTSMSCSKSDLNARAFLSASARWLLTRSCSPCSVAMSWSFSRSWYVLY